jgi:capsular polysaccharide transport system ATP-binding protein
MIEFANVTFRTRHTLYPVVFEDVNFRIEDREHVAILAPGKDSGLAVLQELICGADAPDRGHVVRTGSLSWPLPGAGFLHRHMTFAANCRFITRMYGLYTKPFVMRVCKTAAVVDIMEERLDHCPKGALNRFAFSLGLCVPFDTYLLTSAIAGKGEEGAPLQEALVELAAKSGVIVIATNGKGVADLCERAYVLDSGKIVPHDDVEDALAHLKQLVSKASDDEEMIREVPEEELVDDFF